MRIRTQSVMWVGLPSTSLEDGLRRWSERLQGIEFVAVVGVMGADLILAVRKRNNESSEGGKVEPF
jgi:hypothetical protein